MCHAKLCNRLASPLYHCCVVVFKEDEFLRWTATKQKGKNPQIKQTEGPSELGSNLLPWHKETTTPNWNEATKIGLIIKTTWLGWGKHHCFSYLPQTGGFTQDSNLNQPQTWTYHHFILSFLLLLSPPAGATHWYMPAFRLLFIPHRENSLVTVAIR